MQTIFKPGIWKILAVFYEGRNKPVHLREISRRAKMNESTAFRHLKAMVGSHVLTASADGNMKKFCVSREYVPQIFPLFDNERLERLPLLRRNAVKLYLEKLESKPLLVFVFGSTAKGTFTEGSDLDLLVVTNSPTGDAEHYVEAQTNIAVQALKLTEKQFKKELREKNDMVVQSAITSGFPVFNQKYYYEALQ